MTELPHEALLLDVREPLALAIVGECCRTLGVSVAASLPVSVCMM